MIKLKITLLTLFIYIFASMFTGCEPQLPRPFDVPEATDDISPVKLTIAMWEEDSDYLQKVIDEFKKNNPNYSFDLLIYPSQEYHESKLVKIFTSDVDIDLFATSNTSEFYSFVSKDVVLSIDSFINNENFSVKGYGPLYEGIKINDKIYGLPYMRSVYALFYNKDLFDDQDMPYPENSMTTGSYKLLAKKMTIDPKEEDDDKIFGANIHTDSIYWMGHGIQTGSTIVDKNLSVFKDALQLRMDMEEDGSIMEWTEQIDTEYDYNRAFKKGKFAMHVMKDSHIAELREGKFNDDFYFDWDVVNPPRPVGAEENASWGMPSIISIAKKSKNPEEAWKFLRFFAGKKGATILAENRAFPGYMDKDVKNAYLKDYNLSPENIAIIFDQIVYVEYPPVEDIDLVRKTIYEEEAEEVYLGDQEVEGAIDDIEERIMEEIQ